LAGNHADEERSLGRQWAETLDKQPWDKCSDTRFTAVARWLHANRHTSPAELAGRLTTLGQPDETLKEEVIRCYGDRSKENKLQAQRGGIKLVGDRLSELANKSESFWPLGIEMLAERVAGAVELQKKGGS
jgi:hypothetical protein